MARYVTTSIPYVNAKPHAGHALEFVQADAYARGLRVRGEDVRLLTGTDDNALKNVQAAEAAGRPVAAYVDEHAERFVALEARLGISYDDFIRTSSDPRHRAGVEKLWRAMKPEDIYKKTYRGLYCVGCEEFKTEGDLTNGECPEHPGKKLEEIEEENYFFRLSAYASQIEELIASDRIRIVPESRKNETLAFVRRGLQDFSVSRSAARARGWGIPVPGDPDQYLYVWYDALGNYITALGYAEDALDYARYWTDAVERTHIIGKGINRFHTVYWPAMLLSGGLPLPTQVFVHGYITSEGQKMSKSIGNVIDPNDLIDTYGADAVRYFFLRHGHPVEDFDMTKERCDEWYTANLVNGVGNLVARVMKLAEGNLESPVALEAADTELDPAFLHALDAFRFNDAADYVFAIVGECDAYMTAKEPYKKLKSEDEGIREDGREDLRFLVRKLALVGAHLAPLMPGTSEAILAAVRENRKPENLFPRLA
jgi:methionyl-tRNA synthetase